MTKRFAKELGDMLEEKNISQSEFGRMSKMIRSKISRLIANRIYCDQPTLEKVVDAFPGKDDKLRLLNAYAQDVFGSRMLALFASREDPLKEIKLEGFSRKTQERLAKLLRSSHVDDFETLLAGLFKSWGM